MDSKIYSQILDHLCHIRAAVDRTQRDIRDVTVRLEVLGTRFNAIRGEIAGLNAQSGQISTRIGRVDTRLEKIERYLGPSEA
jgi:hypothetical protein